MKTALILVLAALVAQLPLRIIAAITFIRTGTIILLIAKTVVTAKTKVIQLQKAAVIVCIALLRYNPNQYSKSYLHCCSNYSTQFKQKGVVKAAPFLFMHNINLFKVMGTMIGATVLL